MKFLLDSSAFIAFFSKNDIFHKETVKFIEVISQENDVVVIVPVTVFLETINILKKNLGKFNSQLILEVFNRCETLDLTFEFTNLIIRFFEKINLKTSDAIIAAASKITSSTLITWDKKLQKEAKKMTPVLTPSEFLAKF